MVRYVNVADYSSPISDAISGAAKAMFGDTLSPALKREQLTKLQRENTAIEDLASIYTNQGNYYANLPTAAPPPAPTSAPMSSVGMPIASTGVDPRANEAMYAGTPAQTVSALPGFGRMEADLAGKTRRLPLSRDYVARVSDIVRGLGPEYDVRVVSAGQVSDPKDGPRTGSHRHDVNEEGVAGTADFVILRNGVPVTPEQDPALYARLIGAAAPEFPGIGHYNWGVHVGGGDPAF